MKRFILFTALALAPLTAWADHGQQSYRHHYRYQPRPSVFAPREPVRYTIAYQGNDGQRLTIIVLDRYTGQLSRQEFRVNALDRDETPRRRQPRSFYNPGRTGGQVNRDIQQGR